MTCAHPEIITAPSGAKWCRTCGAVNPKPPAAKPKVIRKSAPLTLEAQEAKVNALAKECFRWYAINSLFKHGDIRENA